MSTSQTTQEENTIRHLSCPQCNATLPLRATFCASCGERIKRKKQVAVVDEQDITNRYRITTLIRRRPHINLYFAQDTLQMSADGQPRIVAIRDIEITDLDKEARAKALTLAQQEYDRLRRWHIPHILTSMEMRVFQGHVFLISGIPFLPRDAATSQSVAQLYTLQDFLQSGQGLPKEARALAWIRSLCQAVERLHRQHIILGDLDPYTIVLNKNCAEAEPRLMISWVQPEVQQLLPSPNELSTPLVSYFSAPEALAGKAEVRSDVYSLGALLYLLLTGTPPDEATLRQRRRLRTPRELNTRINVQLDACIMQALALDIDERFSSVANLLTALDSARLSPAPAKQPGPAAQESDEPTADAETVRIAPPSQGDVTRRRPAKEQPVKPHEIPPAATLAPQAQPSQVDGHIKMQREVALTPTKPRPERPQSPASSRLQSAIHREPPPPTPAAPKPVWKQRITGILPALILDAKPATKQSKKPKKPAAQPAEPQSQKQAVAPQTEPKPTQAPKKTGKLVPALNEANETGETSLLKQMQQLIVGQQQHTVEAAAIIETPMRIRPDQAYHLRLRIVGRDEPAPHPNAKKGERPAGLSAFKHGEAIQVEIRSVLQQGYTYVLQHAHVTIPASGHEAEVRIPIQPHPQIGVVSGRRERLHLFFLDNQRRPLYEKPFVVEVFVSPLVQLGREGHHVLTIPF